MTPDQINDFFSFLYEGRIGEITGWVRLAAGVVTSAVIAAIVVIAVKLRPLTAGSPRPPAPAPSLPPAEAVSQPWLEVQRRINSPNPADWNLAVIQADAIFDTVLKGMGLAGETMGDRLLKLDSAKLGSLHEVWEAHKTRNRIAHEADQVLAYEDAVRAVGLFEKALEELQYLSD